MDIKLSQHALNMLKERNIPEEWVWRTISSPDYQNIGDDNNIHYYKGISEHENKILHVIKNPNVEPEKVVTVFFDRRERKKDETKNQQRR